MSWTRRPNPYDGFKPGPENDGATEELVKMQIWEHRDVQNGEAQLSGGWLKKGGWVDDLELLRKPCRLRIVFPPLDYPLKSTFKAFIKLFEVLGVPSAFVDERLRSVSFSFGSQRDPPGQRLSTSAPSGPSSSSGPSSPSGSTLSPSPSSTPASSCVWFHFLCKKIEVVEPDGPVGAGGRPTVKYHKDADLTMLELDETREASDPAAAAPAAGPKDGKRWKTGLRDWWSRYRDKPMQPLAQADYSYLQSGFFLRVNDDDSAGKGDVTLVCFGATDHVWERFQDFFAAAHENPQVIEDVLAEPYALLDIIMDGLRVEIDENMLKLQTIIGPAEHNLLATALRPRPEQIPPSAFVGLHNLAKHRIHLTEAVDASLQLCNAISSYVGERASNLSPSAPPALSLREQLRAQLAYRALLLTSTKLGLSSLGLRLANAIALSFNLLSQQDSRIMIRDSGKMSVLASVTMIFLPSTAVASIIGSQLFIVSPPGGTGGSSWSITATPLFAALWYAAVPLTLIVVLGSWLLQREHGEVERRETRDRKWEREQQILRERERRPGGGAQPGRPGRPGGWERVAGWGQKARRAVHVGVRARKGKGVDNGFELQHGV